MPTIKIQYKGPPTYIERESDNDDYLFLFPGIVVEIGETAWANRQIATNAAEISTLALSPQPLLHTDGSILTHTNGLSLTYP